MSLSRSAMICSGTGSFHGQTTLPGDCGAALVGGGKNGGPLVDGAGAVNGAGAVVVVVGVKTDDCVDPVDAAPLAVVGATAVDTWPHEAARKDKATTTTQRRPIITVLDAMG